MDLKELKGIARSILDLRPWMPSHARLALAQVYWRNRNRDAGRTDLEHLHAAARWLERAQNVMSDGGVCGRYRLDRGWTSSYPETTGYIIPTLLALAQRLGDSRFTDRARRCVEFLLPLQLEGGAFPGGEVHQNRTAPSPFNTAQIVCGLTAWHRATGDAAALAAACRAGDWLVSVQDPDGAFRRHTYLDTPTTYTAHASCWLAELGQYADRPRHLAAAARHLDWVLGHHDPHTGWFDRAGFGATELGERVAVTHTIAYTIWGVLISSIVLGRQDGIAAAARAAEQVARRLELSGWLPGVLDHRWRGQADYACLTGNAQMALIWFRLHELTGDHRLVNAALKAIDLVKRAQPLDNGNPDIRGGIAGSDPIWGDYISRAIPNWPAKFFVDALLAKEAAMQRLAARAPRPAPIPAEVPRSLAEPSGGAPRVPLRTVLYAGPRSRKVAQMVLGWAEWGYAPTAVVIERDREPGFRQRLRTILRCEGLRGLLRRIARRPAAGLPSGPAAPVAANAARAPSGAVAEFCATRGIPVIEMDALDSDGGVAAVKRLQPDLAIHAGAGILRAPLLAIPPLGTLNAHMGLLPSWRGMNVVEWAAFCGQPVGCSVHLVDPGIDTGDILCVRALACDGISSIARLRAAVDEAQIALLGEVVRHVLSTGALPPRRGQTPAEGAQFYRMHPEIAAMLEAALKSRAGASREE